jgi:hypothetical protein
VTEAQHHSIVVVTVFCVTALGLLVYKRARPEHRPETIRLAISRCVLCAAAFAANAFLMGLDIRGMRLQALAAAPVNFALIMMVAAICTIQARSLGTVDISPRARRWLRYTPRIFVLSFAANLAMSMAWPVPVLDRFTPAPVYYLANRAFVTIPEGILLGIAAFVSFQAAGSQEPVSRIRLQHACFCFAQVMLVLTALNTYSVVGFRVFVEDHILRRGLIEAALQREVWLAASAASFYVMGFALYYTNDRRTRTITRFSKWRRIRQGLDQKLWAMETGAFKRRLPNYDCVAEAARELVDRARSEGTRDFESSQVRLALDTFKLFAFSAESGDCPYQRWDTGFGALPYYHRALLRETRYGDIAWTVTSRHRDLDLTYSAMNDPLPEAVKKLREFLYGPSSRRLVAEPQWFQLAAVAAADADLLDQDRKRRILEGHAVKDRVLRAYKNAKLAAQIKSFSEPSGTPSQAIG